MRPTEQDLHMWDHALLKDIVICISLEVAIINNNTIPKNNFFLIL